MAEVLGVPKAHSKAQVMAMLKACLKVEALGGPKALALQMVHLMAEVMALS